MNAPAIQASAAHRASLSEAQLVAAWQRLLTQPALWAALALPPPSVALARQAPWSAYWASRLAGTLEPAAAREIYQACQARFAAEGERWGALLCIAAAIESFYVDEGPLEPLDGWIAQLQAALPEPHTAWPSPELQARIMACGAAVLLRDPTLPLLAGWAAQATPLLRQLPPGAARLKLATFLLQYHLWRGEFHKTGLVVDSMPGLDPAGLLPGEAIMWHESVASHARLTGQYGRGLAAVDAALALASAHGLPQHDYALHAHGASLALAAHDAERARQHLGAMRPVLDRRTQADQTHYWHFSAGLQLLCGQPAEAVELARAALANSGEIGGPYRRAAHALSLGQALLQAGELDEAQALLAEAEATARAIAAGLLAFSAALMQAATLLRRGEREAAAASLRSVLAEGAQHGYRTLAGWWLPEVVAALALLAIEHDLEAGYVRRLVRERGLPGSDPAQPLWPWALSLRGFGEFELVLGDAPLPRSGPKTAQRPLDLLRALLAHGSTPLPAHTAMEWLWPEAEPAAQRKAFDVALLRLRRVLADPRLLRLEGGKLALAPEWVWTDVGALAALMHRIGSAHGASLPELTRWSAQLLDLMRGPFLAGDEHDWAHAARSRYRQRFIVTVAQLAEHMAPLDSPAAARLYERALDMDPLAESLARRLMRLHAQHGDHAEALRVLRMSRTMLLLGAGLAPARETLQLAAELGLPLD